MKIGVQRYGVRSVISSPELYLAGFGRKKLEDYTHRRSGIRLGEMIAEDFAFKVDHPEYIDGEVHSLQVVVVTPKHYDELLRKADQWDALQ